MAEFAADARIVGIDRIVVDKTGLTGRYDFELHHAPPGRRISKASKLSPTSTKPFRSNSASNSSPFAAPYQSLSSTMSNGPLKISICKSGQSRDSGRPCIERNIPQKGVFGN